MLSPGARAALRRQWLDDLTAEIARRTKTKADDNEAASRQLLDELQQMADRLTVLAYPGDAEIAEELVQANADWSRINPICDREDLAPANAIALVLSRNPKLAMRMLKRLARARYG